MPDRQHTVRVVRAALKERWTWVPTAWAEEIVQVLEDDEPDHYVTFNPDNWFIEHSMACRLAGTIGTCKWNEYVADIPQGVVAPGRYLIEDDDEEPWLSRDLDPVEAPTWD